MFHYCGKHFPIYFFAGKSLHQCPLTFETYSYGCFFVSPVEVEDYTTYCSDYSVTSSLYSAHNSTDLISMIATLHDLGSDGDCLII